MTITVRKLGESDLAAADRVYRLAFGTLLGLPDPTQYRGDADLIRTRARAYPDGAFIAESDGEIVGVSLANNWGSLGVLGPVAVHPDHWHKGIAQSLLGPTVDAFGGWGARMVGLFTFPDSGHLRLYQHFGFWARFLTPIMTKDVTPPGSLPETLSLAGSPTQRAALVAQCHALAGEAYPGLDLRREIDSVIDNGIGDVLILTEGGEPVGFALCHCGRGSEGGSQICYVKFAVVRSGKDAAARLTGLLAACNAFASARGAKQLSAGVSAGRHPAHRLMVELGFRIQMQGVAMHRPWIESYDRPDVFVLDDWR